MTNSGESDYWTSVEFSRSRTAILDLELVLIAVGLETRIQRSFLGWRLYTPATQSQTARRHLRLYKLENQEKTIPDTNPFEIEKGTLGVIGYLAVIWCFFVADGALGSYLTRAGALYAVSIQDGAWWSAVTALTLHDGIGHIVSNSVFGGLMALIAGRYFGSGFAWLLILLAATIANVVNGYLRPDDFAAIGASTANFASLGLVAGYVGRHRQIGFTSVKVYLAPMVGAFAILVFIGFGGARVDTLGHALGLFVGIGVGLLIARMNMRWLGRTGQYLAISIVVLVLLASWALALN